MDEGAAGFEDPLDDIAAELAEIEAAGLRRTLRAAHGPVGAQMLVDGRTVLNFCSNNYLGLADHPAAITAATEAMVREGLGAGAARLIGGSLAVHRALEERLARWKGTQAALLFGSGYQANVGILSALAGPHDAIYSDELNHASIVDGARLSRATVHVYPHGDLPALERLLAGGTHFRRRLVATESIFSMDGDVAPLDELGGLARRHQALLIVDEAHAAGVVGAAGVGLAAGCGAHLQMGTLGKAFGASGAYAASSREIVDLLIQKARSFVFTTAPTVPVVAAAGAALEIVASEEGARRRESLSRRAVELRQGLVRLGRNIPSGPGHITPLIVGESRRALGLSAALFERDIFVQAIRPPTVREGTARLRITVMATHTAEHVARLLEALAELGPRFWQ